MRQRLASFQQGCRGWLTSKVTGPTRKMSPMQTDCFAQAGDGEIFAEGAARHVGHAQLVPPFRIVIGAVRQHRFIDAAVILEIRLAVAGEIRRADEHRTFDRAILKKPVVHGLSCVSTASSNP